MEKFKTHPFQYVGLSESTIGISGWVHRCLGCGDWIFTPYFKKSFCNFCSALRLEYGFKKNLFYRTGEWARIRKLIFKTKGTACVYCGHPATCVDHQTPYSRGGTNKIENLEPTCKTCNFKKGNRTHAEFILLLSRRCRQK